jgi:hypothetical protein
MAVLFLVCGWRDKKSKIQENGTGITFFSEYCPYFSRSFVIKNENTIQSIFTNMNGQK